LFAQQVCGAIIEVVSGVETMLSFFNDVVDF